MRFGLGQVDSLLGLFDNLLRVTCHQEQEVLLRLLTVREVHDQTTREAIPHGGCSDHLDLLWRRGIELEGAAGTLDKARVQRREELVQALERVLNRLFSGAEPLKSGDGDRPVEGASSETEAVAHVLVEHVSLDLTVDRHVQHGFGDVKAQTHVSLLTEYVP